MNVDRAKVQKIDGSAARAALTALVRLLAQQAAREWIERRPEFDCPPAPIAPSEKQS